MKKVTALMGTSMLVASPALSADIVIGVPNWASVNATAHILEVVIEENLGLDVELQNGTNPIVFEAMDKGSMLSTARAVNIKEVPHSRIRHSRSSQLIRTAGKCIGSGFVSVKGLYSGALGANFLVLFECASRPPVVAP